MAYDLGGVRPQRARRKLNGARVSARNLPVEPSWSCRRRAPRHGCQPCLRGSRPSSRVPSALSLSASRFRDTHSTRTVQPRGTCRAPATVAARVVWVRVADGTTTALHPGPGKEGPRSLFRYVFNDVEQCLTMALGSQRARTAVLRVPLRWTFVKHACGKLWTLVSTSETQT